MNEAVLEKLVMILVVTPTLAFWPYMYIRFKKGCNHFLFVSAFFGMMVMTVFLLSAIAAPFALFLVKLLPQLQQNGVAMHLDPVIGVFETIGEWYAILLFPVLYLALPPLLYRRYGIFRSPPARSDSQIAQ